MKTNKKILIQKYIKENKFMHKIAKELNCCTATIFYNLRANKNRDYWYAYFTYIMENWK